MIRNPYEQLRNNASLAKVAEAAALDARRTWREKQEQQYQIEEARKSGQFVRPDSEHYLQDLRDRFHKERLLARHLNRLARTDHPVYPLPEQQ